MCFPRGFSRRSIRIRYGRLIAVVSLIFAWIGFLSETASGEVPEELGAQASGATVVLPTAGGRTSWGLPPATNVISYWYGSGYHTAFVMAPNASTGATIARNTLEYTHTSRWQIGSNFADIYLNKSNAAEPTRNGDGALEVYGVFREKLGLNELTGTHAFKFGPVRNVAAEIGANLMTKNSTYGPAERSIYLGPNIQFKVPRAYLSTGFHARKEWNKQEITGKTENYTWNFNIEPNWIIPFTVGKVHFEYGGIADFNTPKGIDSFGSHTVSEFMTRNWVTVDIGALLFHQPGMLTTNAGFRYWHNEFGKPAANPGGEEMAPMFGVSLRIRGGESRKGI